MIAAVTPLLMDGVSGLRTIVERNDQPTAILPAMQCPGIVLADRPHTEDPLAIGAANRSWWLDCNLWAYYQIGDDGSAFRDMREQLEAVLRSNTWLGGTADDATYNTKLVASGRHVQVHNWPVIPTGIGQMVRHCTISTFVREVVFFAAV